MNRISLDYLPARYVDKDHAEWLVKADKENRGRIYTVVLDHDCNLRVGKYADQETIEREKWHVFEIEGGERDLEVMQGVYEHMKNSVELANMVFSGKARYRCHRIDCVCDSLVSNDKRLDGFKLDYKKR